MSFTKEFSFNDTTGAASKTLDLSSLNLSADFVVKDRVNAEEITLSSLRAPLDCPETIGLASHPVENIYKNSGISAAGQAPEKKGTKLVVKDHVIMTKNDESTGLRYYGPCSCVISVTVPNWPEVTSLDVVTLISRAASALFNSDDAFVPGTTASVTGIEMKLRGAEVPKGVS